MTLLRMTFDKANGRLCQEKLLRSRNFSTMVTSGHTSPLFCRHTSISSHHLMFMIAPVTGCDKQFTCLYFTMVCQENHNSFSTLCLLGVAPLSGFSGN